nr:hypothetical protein [Sphaerisporangium album]
MGGSAFVKPKGKGKRTALIPLPLIPLLKLQREAQRAEEKAAGKKWRGIDLVWCRLDGSPIDPGDDWDEWKGLLRAAGSRRTPAFTTPGTRPPRCSWSRAWTSASCRRSSGTTTKRYTHVTSKLASDAAARIGRALWDD